MQKPLKQHAATSDAGSLRPVAEVSETVMRVVDHNESLDILLQSSGPRKQGSESLFREMAYGTCRFYPRIDWFIGKLLERPLRKKDRVLHFLLAVGIYQIEYMKTPNYAVLNETVEAVANLGRNWARKLVNGVLRNYLRNRTHFELSDIPLHQACAFPEFLFDRIKADWPEQYATILSASNSRPPLTLRVNLQSVSREQAMQAITEHAMPCVVTKDSPFGLHLLSPVHVQQIPGFCQGTVSVQDESAQLAVPELQPDENLNVLDACSAPGGKTSQILEQFPKSCQITAVDLNSRCDLIHENLKRLKLNAHVVAGDLLNPRAWWNGNLYDRILLDVPCSGSGVIRRHPDIKYRRKPEDLDRFHQLQISLLESAWNLLRSGGIVLYVTCSIFKQENDHVIEAFMNLKRGGEILPISLIPGVTTRFGIQRVPGFQDGDGFYYCKIRKSLPAAGE